MDLQNLVNLSLSNTTTLHNSLYTILLTNLLQSLLTAHKPLRPQYPKDVGEQNLRDSYDFIVVGSGSSGSPLAAKLTDNPDWNVLLIEAGGDPPIESEVPGIFHAMHGSEYDWNYRTVPQRNACRGFNNISSAWVRGKMLGGCSAINAMIYQQGSIHDYDRWAELGNQGWSHSEIKQYFEEQLAGQVNEAEKIDNEFLDHLKNDMISGAKQMGFDFFTDPIKKSQGPIGYLETLQTVKNGARNSAARMFLVPVRDRSNFHLLKNTLVTKVTVNVKNNQADGVEVINAGKVFKIKAEKEVILSAGAVNSPQILMLSGIGPKSHLDTLNIPIIKDLPVGENLQDHSNIKFFIKIENSDEFLLTEENLAKEFANYLTNRKGLFSTNCPLTQLVGFINTENTSDDIRKKSTFQFHFTFIPRNEPMLPTILMKLNYKSKFIDEVVEYNKKSALIQVFSHVLHPYSKGHITLSSRNPLDPPVINPNYNSDQRDVNTILKGVEHLENLTRTDSMKKFKAELLKLTLDDCEIEEVNDITEEEKYWRCYIKHFTSTIFHPVGTAKMSPKKDGVVDDRLRVKSIKGLRVADASIMPDIVGGNTNAPCMMIGQKAGDIIKKDWEIRKDEL